MSELKDAPRVRVIRNLKQWIDQGILMPGHPVPSERVLSEQFQVTRATVRRALDMLSDEGVLSDDGGRQRIVTSVKTQPHNLMQSVVAVLMVSQDESPSDDLNLSTLQYIGQGAQQAIRKAGLHALALHPDRMLNSGTQAGEIDHFIKSRPYGVIITETHTGQIKTRQAELAAALTSNGVPVVAFGGGPEMAVYDRVASDHEAGSYMLTRWLIEQGRRRIQPMWSDSPLGYWLPYRRAGYERAMREYGLEILPTIALTGVPDTDDSAEGFVLASRLTAGYLVEHLRGTEKIDALLLGTDGEVPAAARACRLCGVEPQRDILLVGYDNQWHVAPEQQFEPVPPVATIDKRNVEIGVQLVQLLLDRVEGRLPEEPQARLVEPRLIIEPAKASAH